MDAVPEADVQGPPGAAPARRRRPLAWGVAAVGAAAVLALLATKVLGSHHDSASPIVSSTQSPSPSSLPAESASPPGEPSFNPESISTWLTSLPRTSERPLRPLLVWKHSTIEFNGVTYRVPDAGHIQVFAQLPNSRLLVRALYRTSDDGRVDAWSSAGILAPDGTFTTLFKDSAGELETNTAYDATHHVIAVGHIVVNTNKGSTRPPTYVVTFYNDRGTLIGKRSGIGALRIVGYISAGLIVDPDIGADHPREELWPSIKAPAQDLGSVSAIVALGATPQDRLIIFSGACQVLDSKAGTVQPVSCEADDTLSPSSAWYLDGNGVVYSTSSPSFNLPLLPAKQRAWVSWQDDDTVLVKEYIGDTTTLWQALCDVPSGSCARTVDEPGPPHHTPPRTTDEQPLQQ